MLKLSSGHRQYALGMRSLTFDSHKARLYCRRTGHDVIGRAVSSVYVNLVYAPKKKKSFFMFTIVYFVLLVLCNHGTHSGIFKALYEGHG